MQFTEENRPICIKCKINKALMLINQMWICGECFHEWNLKQIKLKQKAFLEG